MHSVTTHPLVKQLISVYYRVGVWNRENEHSPIRLRIKWFYFIYQFMVPISAIIGSFKNENTDDRIFLVETSIVNGTLSAKFWLMMQKQEQILELLEKICIFSIQDKDCFRFFNKKLELFTKVTKSFMYAVIPLAVFSALAPFAGDRKLFFKLALPFDAEKNDFNFLMANFYTFTAVAFAFFFISFSVVLWYIMFVCSLRYNVLGIQLTKMGRLSEESKGVSDRQKQNAFRRDLWGIMKDCLLTRNLVCEIESFCSTIFFIELGTSGLCICASVYCLAFNVSENIVGRLVHLSSLGYNVAGILITTYLGNEITLTSNRLSYCVFESDWYDQPQSTKFIITILGEFLQQPQVMVVAKLYTLTLETFTRILNFAYSTFNILKNFRS
ncbi:odorant receptor 94b-like isoform X2 [Bradysia coprophila]|uniref:odorant receptor 94b-like isoform X2 n=1 Tax=Bradysia coprophila TaxID=38358 RepID=UPI00187DB429|nr:odorant receptor 94b-like isoform X2 [Bradysia coprophila]